MTSIEFQLRNAIVMLRNYADADQDPCDADFTRQQIAKMEAALPDYTRAGNLSPNYLLMQDRAERLEHGATIPLSAAPGHSVASAHGETAA